jgi:hypothetical protein
MNHWEDGFDETIIRQDGDRHQYSTFLPEIAKTEFYKLFLMLTTMAKEVSNQTGGHIGEIRVNQTEAGSIQIEQDDRLRFHLTLDLAKSGKRITINGHSTKPDSESRWLKPLVLKLGVDSKNHLHIQRDDRGITVEDIAKMIFVAIRTGSDFQ